MARSRSSACLSTDTPPALKVIEETLRMYPLLSGTLKEAPSEGVTLSQYYMPAGTPLFVSGCVVAHDMQ